MANYTSIMTIFYKGFSILADVKAKEDSSKLMEAITKEILKIMWQMVTAFMQAKEGLDMKDNGKTMFPMVQVKLLTQMVHAMLDNF